MKLLAASAFAVGLGLMSVSAQAMPIAPVDKPATNEIRVAQGCGPGMHRGAAGMPMLADLTDAQREQILAIREQHRRDTWDTMGQIRTEQFKLRRLHSADKVDPDAVVDQQKRIDELRLKMTRSRVVEHNEVLAVLTPEQRKAVRERGPGWMHGGGR